MRWAVLEGPFSMLGAILINGKLLPPTPAQSARPSACSRSGAEDEESDDVSSDDESVVSEDESEEGSEDEDSEDEGGCPCAALRSFKAFCNKGTCLFIDLPAPFRELRSEGLVGGARRACLLGHMCSSTGVAARTWLW